MTEPYTGSILIAAEPMAVFRHFTDPRLITAWMGDAAEVEPQPGGRFALRFEDKVVEGRYVEVDPPRRLVITWGRRGSSGFPPGVSRLEVSLSAEIGGTLVSIVHSGLPSSERARHAEGWQHYFGRLAEVAAGRPVEAHHVPLRLTIGVDFPDDDIADDHLTQKPHNAHGQNP